MPATQATMTAARAIIKRKDGKAIGFMKNLRVTENKQRGSVMGLGEVIKRERPLTSITCTWSCDFYLIDLKQTGLPGVENREVQSVKQYTDTLVLKEEAIDVYIYKKDVGTVTGGVVTGVNETLFGVLKDVYLDNTSWDLTENAVSGMAQSGEYLSPIILSI